MPQQTEPSANNALGLLLQKMLPRSTVRSEHTQTIVDQPGLHPDIVITASGRSPVVVEAEYMPAYTAEADAKGRLGLEVVNTARLIESAIALRYPEEVHRAENLAEAIAGATLSYCVLSEDEGRFPESGWLEGSVTDLAELVRLVSVPQRAVDAAADALQAGIERVAAILGSLENSKPDILTAIAALLARLAISKMEGVDWSDAEAIGKLRIGDFACGTGALLSAVYDQIAVRHEQAGGDVAALHPVMMEEVLYGCDVMPSAIHITGSTLSGMEPQVKYGKSRLYTLAYGRQEDGSVRIGSLELLQSSSTMTLFNTNDPAFRTGSVGQETATQVIVEIPDEGFDMVIMNPPFTRATNHEGAHADITNPAFAAFGATSTDQTAMGKRVNQLGKGTCYHGNAGIASAFAALGNKKLKPGGNSGNGTAAVCCSRVVMVKLQRASR